MKELNGIWDTEANSIYAEGIKQELNKRPELARSGERPKPQAQEKSNSFSQELKAQREARDKINGVKMELSSIAKEERIGEKAVSDPQRPTNSEKKPTLMEWLMNGLKKLKEWIAKRRKEKSKIPLCVLQGKQAELIFVQTAQKKEAKPLPVYILGEYKKGIAEKIITAIEYILRYISKAVEAMFSKRKNPTSQKNDNPKFS